MGGFSMDSCETRRLLAGVADGDAAALDVLLARHRDYIRRMVDVRLDPMIRRRVDPSDVVQETQLEAARRVGDYLARPPMAFRLWLRQIAYDRLLMLRRRHVDAKRRDVSRELPLPEDSCVGLAARLGRNLSTPSRHLIEGELTRRVRQAVARLEDEDREVLLMRHYEGLSNQEVAQVLHVEPPAASKRYGRALLRLRALLYANPAESSS